MQVKLSDLVKQFIEESRLPFYMDYNKYDERIATIRRMPVGLANSIGFVSDKRAMVCIPLTPTAGPGWLDPARPNFFDELRRVLEHEAAQVV